MGRNTTKSAVAHEIKKEYLKEHLEHVRVLIARWIPELGAPAPLAPQGPGPLAWRSVYRPAVEQIPDENHMVRRHVRSRALWNHHANWEKKLDDIWSRANQVRVQAEAMHAAQTGKAKGQHTEFYVATALWTGFELANWHPIAKLYKVPDDKVGVLYAAYKIEASASTRAQRLAVEGEHWDLVYAVAALGGMKHLVALWREALELQEHMQEIAQRIFDSRDILYPCRFCRHLWE